MYKFTFVLFVLDRSLAMLFIFIQLTIRNTATNPSLSSFYELTVSRSSINLIFDIPNVSDLCDW